MSDLNALDLEPGEIVGGYTLISRLGGGAMGSVWRVRDDGGQVYAMKILRDSLKDDSETGQDYQNDDVLPEGNSGSYGNADTSSGYGSAGYGTSDSSTAGYDSASDNAADNGYGTSGYGQNSGNAGAYPSQSSYDTNESNTSQHHHHSHDPHVTARERLRREAVAMRKINHPGVCAIVDMELDDSLAFIVTELIEGKNLRDDVAANGRYIGDDLQRLAAKLIDAVRAVHAQGIIHRDIKPTNVMVSASGPVLVDFGIAMTAGESHVTRTGLVMGTPGFIAPEIIDGAESNEATDWWSLASVIAFAATGRPVFGSKPMMAVLEREASGNANLAGLPPNTLNALRSALNPDPAKRCSPDQLLQAITLDALNPFENGELDDDGNIGNGNTTDNNSNNSNGAEGVVPPFGQTPRPNSGYEGGASNSPRTKWTNAPIDPVTEPIDSPQRQIRGSTRAMPQSNNQNDAAITMPLAPTTGTMPLSTEMTQSLAPTSPLSTSNPVVMPQQSEAATMPLTMAPTPYIYGQPNAQPGYTNQPGYTLQPQSMLQPVGLEAEPAVNPADIRRGKLISRSTLPLWLLTAPLALLSTTLPTISIFCAIALLWFLLILGYSEEGQLEREGRRGGIRKGGDPALRMVGLPWHILEGLIFTIPRALLLLIIAGVGPVVVNLVSGLPTHMVALSIGSWHIPLPLPADVSLSYSSLSLAIFMAAAWLVTVFGPKTTLLRIGAGRLRGAAYPKPENTALPQSLSPNLAENGYENPSNQGNGINDTYDIADDEAEMDMDDGASPKHHSARRWVLLAIWLIVVLATLALALTNHQIDWIPLPTPQL